MLEVKKIAAEGQRNRTESTLLNVSILLMYYINCVIINDINTSQYASKAYLRRLKEAEIAVLTTIRLFLTYRMTFSTCSWSGRYFRRG